MLSSYLRSCSLQVTNYVAYDELPRHHGDKQLPVAVVDYMRWLAITPLGRDPTLLVQTQDLLLVARLARGLLLRPKIGVAYTGTDSLADVKHNLEVACCGVPGLADDDGAASGGTAHWGTAVGPT